MDTRIGGTADFHWLKGLGLEAAWPSEVGARGTDIVSTWPLQQLPAHPHLHPESPGPLPTGPEGPKAKC